MIIQVLLKERINEFDLREWTVPIACGHGRQPLRWLGHAACSRMAYNTGDVAAKYVPQAVRALGGKVIFHPDKLINEILQDGAQVEVECSRGPDSYTFDWHGKPPPVDKDFFPVEKKPEELDETVQGENVEAPPQDPAAVIAVDSEGNPIPIEPSPPPIDKRVQWANDLLACIDWTKYSFAKDLNTNYETWEKECGILQSALIWYCAKGDEIEDKDFGGLNFEQFRQMFVDLKLCNDQSSEDLVKKCFHEGLRATGSLAAYQLTPVEFVPAVVQFITSPFFEQMVPDRDKRHLSTKVTHFIRDFLVPCLTMQLSPGLEDLHKAATKWTVCMDVLKENKELFQACIKRCKPPSDMTESKIRVPFRILLPYLRKWLVLGDYWNPPRASLIIIFAYQKSQNVAEFSPVPAGFTFGPKQLRRFLFGASYFAFMESTSLIKISDHAYLRDFLNKVFKRAGVAKPLYTTYEEKKAYLRSILLHE